MERVGPDMCRCSVGLLSACSAFALALTGTALLILS